MLDYCSHSQFLKNHGWILAWTLSLVFPNLKGLMSSWLWLIGLQKFVHFMPLSHPYTAAKVAQVFMSNVFKLHGLPRSIVSDRDAAFTSNFWRELFKLQGTELAISSAYHPQSDRQTAVVNRSLEQYLRAFVGDRPHTWASWLYLAEFWFNSNYHTSTKMSPFEALYGFAPPRILDYVPGLTKVAAVETVLHDKSILLELLKQNLVVAQARMKAQANQHRSDKSYRVGDWVFLRLQPYRQLSLIYKGFHKLSPRYFGPFQILQQVGPMAYKLDLPSDCLIHLVFHVSCLKPGAHTIPFPTLPPIDSDGFLNPEPIAILQ